MSSDRKHIPSTSLLIVISSVFWIIGCGHLQQTGPYPLVRCDQVDKNIHMDDRIDTLNLIAAAFYSECYDKVIQYGTQVQEAYRYKTFSIVKEAGNVFLPEGVLTDYVLESYERGFLTFLLAASYYQLDRLDAVKVELRRMDHEMKAGLYNYGEDPVNVLLQAALWEKLGETGESRVDWENLRGKKPGR